MQILYLGGFPQLKKNIFDKHESILLLFSKYNFILPVALQLRYNCEKAVKNCELAFVMYCFSLCTTFTPRNSMTDKAKLIFFSSYLNSNNNWWTGIKKPLKHFPYLYKWYAAYLLAIYLCEHNCLYWTYKMNRAFKVIKHHNHYTYE